LLKEKPGRGFAGRLRSGDGVDLRCGPLAAVIRLPCRWARGSQRPAARNAMSRKTGTPVSSSAVPSIFRGSDGGAGGPG
jgi:hypothetical protein